MHHVVICIRVNSCSIVKIQQGCTVGEPLITSEDAVCVVDYRSPVIEDSWGRKCRVITWDRQVPSNTFIRIRICSADPGCTSGCGGDCDIVGNGASIKNDLISYLVDGTNYVNALQALLLGSGSLGCTYIGCIGAGPDCCTDADGNQLFESVHDIPWGSEIVVGPIGNLLL
jgi:hypothetical protein